MAPHIDAFTHLRAANYRDRARELRRVAATMSTSDGRKMLLELAFDYERMADALVLNALQKGPSN